MLATVGFVTEQYWNFPGGSGSCVVWAVCEAAVAFNGLTSSYEVMEQIG